MRNVTGLDTPEFGVLTMLFVCSKSDYSLWFRQTHSNCTASPAIPRVVQFQSDGHATDRGDTIVDVFFTAIARGSRPRSAGKTQTGKRRGISRHDANPSTGGRVGRRFADVSFVQLVVGMLARAGEAVFRGCAISFVGNGHTGPRVVSGVRYHGSG